MLLTKLSQNSAVSPTPLSQWTLSCVSDTTESWHEGVIDTAESLLTPLSQLLELQKALIVSPTFSWVRRNWFRLFWLATMVAIGLQKPYAKPKSGMNPLMYDVCWLAMMLLFTGSKYLEYISSVRIMCNDEGGVGVDEDDDYEWEPIKLITSPRDSNSGYWWNNAQDSV